MYVLLPGSLTAIREKDKSIQFLIRAVESPSMPRHDHAVKPNSPLKKLERINSTVRLSVNMEIYMPAETGRSLTFMLSLKTAICFDNPLGVRVSLFGHCTSAVLKLHFFFIWILLCFDVATMSETHTQKKI